MVASNQTIDCPTNGMAQRKFFWPGLTKDLNHGDESATLHPPKVC